MLVYHLKANLSPFLHHKYNGEQLGRNMPVHYKKRQVRAYVSSGVTAKSAVYQQFDNWSSSRAY